MDRDKLLGESRIFQLIIRFSAPSIVGMLVNALYNTVDRIYIGHKVGSAGIAGITVSFPIMLIMMAFSMLVGFGSTSLLSIRLGQKRREEAITITGNSIVLLLAISAAVTIPGLIFLRPLLVAFGASPGILPYSESYLRIILLGFVFQALGFGMNNQIRALGSPRTAMLTMFVGGGLNVVLDPIFIFVFNWDMQGAAFATILSQMASSVWVMAYLLGKRNDLRPGRRCFRLRRATVEKILTLGIPPFLMQLAASALMIVLNHSLVRYGGDMAVSAVGIAMSVSNLIMMPVFGLNQGVQPIIGYNYGARNFARVRQAVATAAGIATLFVSLGFILSTFFSRDLVLLFNSSDPALIRLGSRVVTVYLIMLPIIGFQVISSGFFQAVGKPKQATLVTLSRQLLVFIPAVLVLPLFYGLDGILYAAPLSDLTAAFITGSLLIHTLRNLEREKMRGPAAAEPLSELEEEAAEERLAAETCVSDVPPVL